MRRPSSTTSITLARRFVAVTLDLAMMFCAPLAAEASPVCPPLSHYILRSHPVIPVSRSNTTEPVSNGARRRHVLLDLEPLFAPRFVAIVGASDTRPSGGETGSAGAHSKASIDARSTLATKRARIHPYRPAYACCCADDLPDAPALVAIRRAPRPSSRRSTKPAPACSARGVAAQHQRATGATASSSARASA